VGANVGLLATLFATCVTGAGRHLPDTVNFRYRPEADCSLRLLSGHLMWLDCGAVRLIARHIKVEFCDRPASWIYAADANDDSREYSDSELANEGGSAVQADCLKAITRSGVRCQLFVEQITSADTKTPAANRGFPVTIDRDDSGFRQFATASQCTQATDPRQEKRQSGW
jgi:hypothetical protein